MCMKFPALQRNVEEPSEDRTDHLNPQHYISNFTEQSHFSEPKRSSKSQELAACYTEAEGSLQCSQQAATSSCSKADEPGPLHAILLIKSDLFQASFLIKTLPHAPTTPILPGLITLIIDRSTDTEVSDMHLSSVSRYILPPISQYVPHHPVSEHPQKGLI